MDLVDIVVHGTLDATATPGLGTLEAPYYGPVNSLLCGAYPPGRYCVHPQMPLLRPRRPADETFGEAYAPMRSGPSNYRRSTGGTVHTRPVSSLLAGVTGEGRRSEDSFISSTSQGVPLSASTRTSPDFGVKRASGLGFTPVVVIECKTDSNFSFGNDAAEVLEHVRSVVGMGYPEPQAYVMVSAAWYRVKFRGPISMAMTPDDVKLEPIASMDTREGALEVIRYLAARRPTPDTAGAIPSAPVPPTSPDATHGLPSFAPYSTSPPPPGPSTLLSELQNFSLPAPNLATGRTAAFRVQGSSTGFRDLDEIAASVRSQRQSPPPGSGSWGL